MVRKKKATAATESVNMRELDAYEHADKQRKNIPQSGIAQHDIEPEKIKTYSFDPHLDPQLQWAGKAEGLSFQVPTSSIHIHESIKPHKIIASVQKRYSEALEGQIPGQMVMFEVETPADRMKRRREAIEFYKHGVDWTNRLIAGDSLVIMNSLLEKEGMAGQVQMVYIDPPYGIKYGSNFQPFVDKRDVKDGKDDDLNQEPEMIKAFRDTWELGIHSYLTYLRNRLLLARELLSESGSVFVQISDENVHHVRELCDEVFGNNNFVTMIYFRTTGGFETNRISRIGDYIIWYAKRIEYQKYHSLFEHKDPLKGDVHGNYRFIELSDGKRRSMSKEEKSGAVGLPKGSKVFALTAMDSQGVASETIPFEVDGQLFYPAKNNHWKATNVGMQQLKRKNRILVVGKSLRYVRFIDDYPVNPINNAWLNTLQSGFVSDKVYVVQTNVEIVKRCLLMSTDPSDLVLDITCGSGTTAYVAEQWGRRWITCDTSRVAITLAKQRLMTATFDYYKLAHPEQGVGSGFIYETVPHVTLKSVANNEPPSTETLYDQPEIEKKKVRVSGPFTVEALPAPVVRPLDEVAEMNHENLGARQNDWREELKATGIIGRGGARIQFSRVEPLAGTRYLQAEAETREDVPRRAVVCFAGETKPLDPRMVEMALNEAEEQRPKPRLLIFAAFQFDPQAAKMIDDTNWPDVTLLKVQMNTDLMTDDLKKKRSSSQSFWLIGQPDVELIHDKRTKNRYKVKVNGFDYYDVKKGTVESGSTDRIAMWMLDTDYDGLCVEPHQVFFPLGGKSGGWNKLAKTLKAEIDPDLIEAYEGCESLPFMVQPNTSVAVKIIDDRGIESLKVLKVGED